MMRELDTVSPVVWPAWCYSGEGQGDAESAGANTELPSTASVATPKPRAKRRGAPASSAARDPTASATTMNGSSDHHNHNNNNNSNNNNNNNNSNNNNNNNSTTNNNNPVKTERLSPTTTTANPSANTPDNNSSSSRSATPSSSYPGTPPGAAPERVASPASTPTGHIKHMEQMMTRNYSDFMRSLAAKYNNTNPNDYFSNPTRNGYPVGLDPRFTPFKTGATPFVGLMAPLTSTNLPSPIHKNNNANSAATSTVAATPATSAPAKYSCSESNHIKKPTTSTVEAQQALYAAAAASNFVPNPFSPSAAANASMFPPMIDMSSTQTLLNMVRTANAHNASQLETYLKGAIKRPPPSESTPLDLSSASLPSYSKKSRTSKSLSVSDNLFMKSDSLLNIPMMDALRTTKERLGKRMGSVSPKPPSRLMGNSGGSSAGSSPKLGPSATVTSQHVYGRNLPCMSVCTTATDRPCSGSADSQTVAHWTVDDVCNYVSSIDICAEYAQNFREQRIDGTSLPLLTEEHLTNTLGMKLGPALKLRATLARRLGHCAICLHCVHCHSPSTVPPPVSPAQTPPTSTAGRPSSTGA